jgi:polar amino acid transport system substrate-binding protein
MSDKARAELAPTGILRAGINLSNFLLVTGRTEKAEPVGVAPDVAKAIAASLGVPITYVTFKSPGELADQAGKNVWDIGLIGAEPQRAAVMTFSAAYVEIEATYMVPPGSPLKSIADVDKKGVRLRSIPSRRSSTASSPPSSRPWAATSPPPKARALSPSTSSTPRSRAWWRA